MRKKSILFVTAFVLLICCTVLFVSPVMAKKKKGKKDAELLNVSMSMVNYSPVVINVTPDIGGGGPSLYIYSAEFSAFNSIAEESIIGSVLSPNRYRNIKWTCIYTVTYSDGLEDVVLGEFAIQYLTDKDGIARIQIYQDHLPSQVVEIDGNYYDLLATVYHQNIMVMIIPHLDVD